jgi:hypothetical protein
MTEHNLDKLFKDALGKAPFAFADDTALAAMKTALIRRKRLLMLRNWGLFSGVSAVFLALIGYLVIPNSSNRSILSEQAIHQAAAPHSLSNLDQNLNPSNEGTAALSSATGFESKIATPPNTAQNKSEFIALSSAAPHALSTVETSVDLLEFTPSESVVSSVSVPIALLPKRTAWLSEYEAQSPQFDPAVGQLPKMTMRHSFSIYAGLNLSESGFESSKGMRMLGAAGIEYGFRVNASISLHTGLAWRVSNGRGLSKESQQVDYGFGISKVTERHETSELHYADLPIDIRYTTLNYGYVFAGARISYLVTVRSEVMERREKSLEQASETHSSSWGDKSGFDLLNTGVRAGYGISVTKKISAEALVDLPLQTIGSSEIQEPQSARPEFRLSVKYTPFKF